MCTHVYTCSQHTCCVVQYTYIYTAYMLCCVYIRIVYTCICGVCVCSFLKSIAFSTLGKQNNNQKIRLWWLLLNKRKIGLHFLEHLHSTDVRKSWGLLIWFRHFGFYFSFQTLFSYIFASCCRSFLFVWNTLNSTSAASFPSFVSLHAWLTC